MTAHYPTASEFVSSFKARTPELRFACWMMSAVERGEVTERELQSWAKLAGMCESDYEGMSPGTIIDRAIALNLVRATLVNHTINGRYVGLEAALRSYRTGDL
jgi:hypothetical protein